MTEWDPEVIRSFLRHMTPHASVIQVLSPKFHTPVTAATATEPSPFGVVLDATEPRFGTEYNRVPIEPEQLAAWAAPAANPALHLPARNPYIPKDFSVKPLVPEPAVEGPVYPAQVANNGRCRLWFKQDEVFRLPKTIMQLYVYSPQVLQSPEAAVLCELFGAYIADGERMLSMFSRESRV